MARNMRHEWRVSGHLKQRIKWLNPKEVIAAGAPTDLLLVFRSCKLSIPLQKTTVLPNNGGENRARFMTFFPRMVSFLAGLTKRVLTD